MKRCLLLMVGLSVFAPVLMAQELSVARQDALIKKYCVRCHNDVLLVGGMSLEHVDPANPDPTIAGMMAGKIDGGAMGAAGLETPDPAETAALARALRAKAAGAEASTGGWLLRVDPLVATMKVKGISTNGTADPAIYTLSLTCLKDMSSQGPLFPSHPSQFHLTADRPLPGDGSLSFVYDIDGRSQPQSSNRADFVLPLPERSLTVRNVFAGESVSFRFDSLNPDLRRIFSTCLPVNPKQ